MLHYRIVFITSMLIIALIKHYYINNNMEQHTFNVMVIVNGYSEIHTSDLTKEEAEKRANELNEMFPDYDYYVDLVEYVEKVERHYNNKAIDGWEDMYPDRD